jgi:hypothetical protein
MSSKTILLLEKHSLDDCPKPWQNFINSFSVEEKDATPTTLSRLGIINAKLRQFNASKIGQTVVFESEEGKLLFILTYA